MSEKEETVVDHSNHGGGDDDAEEQEEEDYLSLVVKDPADADVAVAEYDSMADMEESSTSSNEEEADYDGGGGGPRLPPWMERNPQHPSAAAAAAAQPNQRSFSNNNNYRRIHPLTALHNEIVAFVHLMEPLPSEMEQRDRLVERIRGTVAQHFTDDEGQSSTTAEVQVFGSQATGLFLPTSDIDLVVTTKEEDDDKEKEAKGGEATAKKDKTGKNKQMNKNPEKEDEQEQEYDVASQKSPLQRFAHFLEQDYRDELSYLECVEKTRVPLVKFTHAPTGISVDVCFNQTTGPPAALLMKRYLEALPPLRPLTFVLKYFLAARGLNEPYSGGVGSFMLQLMIVAFLQHRERDAVNFQRPSVYNLGSLLLEFLELYGNDMNYLTTGLSVRQDGFFFPKGAADRKAIFGSGARAESLLALENPLDPTQNVGQSSFRYGMVQRAFAVAYRTVLAHVTAGPNDERELREAPSILATILPPTDYMTSRLVRKRRDRPLAAARGNSNNSSSNKRGYSSPPGETTNSSGQKGRTTSARGDRIINNISTHQTPKLT